MSNVGGEWGGGGNTGDRGDWGPRVIHDGNSPNSGIPGYVEEEAPKAFESSEADDPEIRPGEEESRDDHEGITPPEADVVGVSITLKISKDKLKDLLNIIQAYAELTRMDVLDNNVQGGSGSR